MVLKESKIISIIPDITFYIFSIICSALFIFGIEPINGQIQALFVSALFTIILYLPSLIVVSLFQRPGAFISASKKNKTAWLMIITIICITIFSLFFMVNFFNSILAGAMAVIQIFLFVKNDILRDNAKNYVRYFLIVPIGVFFGMATTNMLVILKGVGVDVSLGNPILGVWGIIFYFFNLVWLVDEKNIVADFLFKHRIYLWIAATIALIIIIL